jgi:hypothetical protein
MWILKRRKSSLAGKLQFRNILFDSSVHELEVDAEVREKKLSRPPAVYSSMRPMQRKMWFT